MILARPDARAIRANLVEAFCGIADAGGAADASEAGFSAWIGRGGESPVGEFAAGLELDAHRARRLAALAASRPSFRVYQLPGDAPAGVAETLARAGFRPSHEVALLRADAPEGFGGATMEEDDREETAMFMARQFFPRATGGVREAFAVALARYERGALFSHRERGALVAALMLAPAGGTVGLYNLCVAPERRGRGFGGDAVRWARSVAPSPLCLHCHPALEPWYRRLGFRPAGRGTVWLCGPRPATMVV